MELTGKLIKNIIDLDKTAYTSSRLHQTKSGYKFKLTDVYKSVDILHIAALLEQELPEYNVNFKIANSEIGLDVVFSFKLKDPLSVVSGMKNGLVDISRITDDHVNEAAYYIAENRGFDGDHLSHWLEAESQLRG